MPTDYRGARSQRDPGKLACREFRKFFVCEYEEADAHASLTQLAIIEKLEEQGQ